MFGDTIDRIRTFNPLTGEVQSEIERIAIYPARHFVTGSDMFNEQSWHPGKLRQQLAEFRAQDKLLEAQRLDRARSTIWKCSVKSDTVTASRTYSRWFSGRAPGERPYTLIDFFPSDFLLIIDESHQTIPQDQGYVRRGSLSQRSADCARFPVTVCA